MDPSLKSEMCACLVSCVDRAFPQTSVLMLVGQASFWLSLHALALHLGKCISAHFNWVCPHLKGFIPVLYPATGKEKKMLLRQRVT